MNKPMAVTRSIVIEREMPHPPEKVWRALTQGPLIEEWLMQNDFQPIVGLLISLLRRMFFGRRALYREPAAE